MKNFFIYVWEVIKIVILACLIVAPIRLFIFQPFFVKGQSMEPNFENGDYLFVDELSYRLKEPQRGEVVVFKYPNDVSQRYIKRIIGLPGETVETKDGKVDIFNKDGEKVLKEENYIPQGVLTLGDVKITLKENEYFVLGDNRVASSDSRRWGPVPREDIIGRVFFRVWPLATLTKFGAPVYE
ncbi:MAG: signal peptidase I [Candidatus Nealsonbacteria bacterium]|nr:signal peptidase I [Candidatus Nealsonbacteria bacterium]